MPKESITIRRSTALVKGTMMNNYHRQSFDMKSMNTSGNINEIDHSTG